MLEVVLLRHRELACAGEILVVRRAAYLQEQALLGVHDFPPARITAEELMALAGDYFGVFLDDRLAGAMQLERGATDRPAVVASLTVHPEFQRRGIGMALMRFAIATVGARSLRLSTAEKNHVALTLYARLGFRSIGRRSVGRESLSIVELERETPGFDERSSTLI